jgi:hypothetical protein
LYLNTALSQKRNGYQLAGNNSKNGYDWWWHSFVAKNEQTGMLQPFFIEYYVINPKLSPNKIIKGQNSENIKENKKPSYAMIKAGTWQENGAIQISNFYPFSQCFFNTKKLDVKIGQSICTETKLSGKVHTSKEEAQLIENLSDSGTLQWDLSITKKLSYSVGYGTSWLLRKINAFKMYWHIQGMKSELSGTIIYNNQKYIVEPQTSYGYQDKNWGRDYTNPWIWLNCNHFVSTTSKQELPLTSLDVGGGKPIIFGIPLNRKIIVVFYYQGKLYEYNFSKFWKKSRVAFNCYSSQDSVYWQIKAINKNSRISAKFSCPKSKMLKIKYENPKGEINHKNLYNGGHASGTLIFERKINHQWVVADSLFGDFGGCEYGEY